VGRTKRRASLKEKKGGKAEGGAAEVKGEKGNGRKKNRIQAKLQEV